MVTEFSTYLEKEWVYGLSNKVYFKHRVLKPMGNFYSFRTIDDQSKSTPLPYITTTEFTISARFAYKEKFIYGDFERISLGTSWPELEVSYTRSLPGVLGAQFNYQRAQVTLIDMWRLGPFGYMNFSTQAGKIYGQVPFPLLMMHQGNETFFYDDGSYNTMNYFEFVSDRWVNMWATYHAEGLLLNKIPIMRRLKWREVVSAKAVVGGYDQRNDQYLSRDWSVTPDGKNDVYTLTKPYFEAAVGVENIFKILRLDMLYRLSYLDHPDIVKVGLRAKIQFDF
jgi:hypothetical protein